MSPITLGTKVKDSLSNFEGTVTARIEYLFDTPQVQVTSNAYTTDGKVAVEWITESRVTIVPAA